MPDEQIATALAVLHALGHELKAHTKRRFDHIPNDEGWDARATWIDFDLRGNLDSIRSLKRELQHWAKHHPDAIQHGIPANGIARNGANHPAAFGSDLIAPDTKLPMKTATDEEIGIALEVLGALGIELKARTKFLLARMANNDAQKERVAAIKSNLLEKLSSIYCLKSELKHWVKRRLRTAERRIHI